MIISNLQAWILGVLTMALGYGVRAKGYKISGNVAIAIGVIGIPVTIYYDKIKEYIALHLADIQTLVVFSAIILGISAIIYVLSFIFYRTRKARLSVSHKTAEVIEESEKSPIAVPSTNFPSVDWLTGNDVMRKYGLSHFELKQHIEKGLPGYAKIPDSQESRPITERDLISLEVWTEQADSMIEKWQFKTEEVEKYIRSHNKPI